jgi:hypothetical protein
VSAHLVGQDIEQTMRTFDQVLEQGAFKQGFIKGVERGERALLLCLLVRRFGELSGTLIHRVTELSSTDEIVRWFDRAIDAATLDDVFASPHRATLGDMFAAPRPELSPDSAGQLASGPQIIDRVAKARLNLDELLSHGAYMEGIQNGMSALVLHQLAHRFGALPESVTQRVSDASIQELERWGERILDAASLADVYAAPSLD